ncbi:MAG: Na+/H+ antiporter NhaC [Proteobacteria bacterium]|nr:Na+/H+ antiporter NhaC [Pseudomonadota bacterium]
MTENQPNPQTREASTLDILLTIGLTVVLLAASVTLFGSDSSAGANQIALVVGAVMTAIIGIRNGHSWKTIEQTMVRGIATAFPAIMILFAVGSLIGVLMISGTVPTMIYYGLKLLNPTFFYPAACLLCAIASTSIGSSWTVAGTLGIGLIAIGGSLGLSIEITAGAIIGGAYFGDKMSPLSDTTNLAPAVVGIDIFTHIRHMVWTTLPSFVFALVIFTVIGLNQQAQGDSQGLTQTLTTLDASFNIHPLLLFPAVVVFGMAYKKFPAIASIMAGIATGLITAVLFQPESVRAFAGSDDRFADVRALWTVLFAGYTSQTGDENIDSLLSRGGMSSMLNTVWLILAAMCFGAGLEKAGILAAIMKKLLKLTHSIGSLVAVTIATCFGTNILGSDQYMAIVLPGRMFKDEYRRHGLHEKNLSRVLEDSATITSPLIPWNTCGAFMAATLGVPTVAYLPFCFFNLINPFVSIAYGYLNISMDRVDPANGSAEAEVADADPGKAD